MILSEDRTLMLKGLPLYRGDAVEVISLESMSNQPIKVVIDT